MWNEVFYNIKTKRNYSEKADSQIYKWLEQVDQSIQNQNQIILRKITVKLKI